MVLVVTSKTIHEVIIVLHNASLVCQLLLWQLFKIIRRCFRPVKWARLLLSAIFKFNEDKAGGSAAIPFLTFPSKSFEHSFLETHAWIALAKAVGQNHNELGNCRNPVQSSAHSDSGLGGKGQR